MQIDEWVIAKGYLSQYLGRIVYENIRRYGENMRRCGYQDQEKVYGLSISEFTNVTEWPETDLFPVNQIPPDEIGIFLSLLQPESSHQLVKLIKNASR